MSFSRKFARLAHQKTLRATAEGNFKLLESGGEPCEQHGRESCRGEDRRRGLVGELIEGGHAQRMVLQNELLRAKCDDCGESWGVRFFADDAGQVRVSFTPYQADPPN